MDFEFDVTQTLSATVVLFALIDALGSVPLFLNFKRMVRTINPFQATAYSFLILVAFLFVGRGSLQMFHVDVSSFAVAGALVLFIIATANIHMLFSTAP